MRRDRSAGTGPDRNRPGVNGSVVSLPRYDENGFLRAAARDGARPFADRAAQIRAMA